MKDLGREEFEDAVRELTSIYEEDPHITEQEAIRKLKGKLDLKPIRKFLGRKATDGWRQVFHVLKKYAEMEWARRYYEKIILQRTFPLEYDPYKKQTKEEARIERKAIRVRNGWFSSLVIDEKKWENEIKPGMLKEGLSLEEIAERKERVVGTWAKYKEEKHSKTTGEEWNVRRIGARCVVAIRKQIEQEGADLGRDLTQIKSKMNGGNKNQQSKAWKMIKPFFIPCKNKSGKWRLRTREEFSLLLKETKNVNELSEIWNNAFRVYGRHGQDREGHYVWGW